MLVVDDQRLIVDTIVEILESYNFRAFAAYDGESALALAARIRPDVLLADVLMPGMNGVELAIAVRSLLPSTQTFCLRDRPAPPASSVRQRGRAMNLRWSQTDSSGKAH